MLTVRKLWTVWLYAAVGALVARNVLTGPIGLDDQWAWPAAVGGALLGLAIARDEVRTMSRYTATERRDTVLGLLLFAGLIGALLTLAIPFPWSIPAAVTWLVAVSGLAYGVVRRWAARAESSELQTASPEQ